MYIYKYILSYISIYYHTYIYIYTYDMIISLFPRVSNFDPQKGPRKFWAAHGRPKPELEIHIRQETSESYNECLFPWLKSHENHHRNFWMNNWITWHTTFRYFQHHFPCSKKPALKFYALRLVGATAARLAGLWAHAGEDQMVLGLLSWSISAETLERSNNWWFP